LLAEHNGRPPFGGSFCTVSFNRVRSSTELRAFYAYSAYNLCMQYTIRNIPETLDEALRRAAREKGKSLNEVAIEALARGAGITGERGRQRDLSDIAGTWRKDPAFDAAVAAQDTVDEGMWQ
jgi:plasmid stability protein